MQAIIQIYFKDGLTLTEIGRRHDRTLECIRRWLAKALRKLRTTKRYRVIQYGVAEYNRQEKKRAQETYDKAYKILSMPDDTPIETLELSSLSNFRLHHIGVETICDLKRKHFRDELHIKRKRLTYVNLFAIIRVLIEEGDINGYCARGAGFNLSAMV